MMVELANGALANTTDSVGFDVVLIIGIAIFGGTVGARLFQMMKIPQVVGYVFIGIVIGPMAFEVIDAPTVAALEPFNLFALGIIGFMVGGELKKDIFTKFGKQALAILLFEGVTAFFLVGMLSFFITWYFADLSTAVAVGVVLGAICTATDPASTLQVLWEYKCRGAVSKMLMAIVALDDALALILYAIAVSIAGVFTGLGDISFIAALGNSLREIVFSLVLGVAAGFLLTQILKRTEEDDKVLAFTISLVLLSIGISIKFHLDVILSAMALGVTMINLAPRRTRQSFELVHKFAVPTYVLFFVLVGARLNVEHVDSMVVLLVAAYLVGSLIGKTAGSYVGSRFSQAPAVIRKYLGFCLYPQGGIAVGLLIAASHRFEPAIAEIIVMVVVIGVFSLQIIGPLATRFGTGKAGEVGMNITEADLIKTYKVGDVVDTETEVISAGTPLSEILNIFARTSSFFYPVVDKARKLVGAITMDGVRNTFTTTEINDWLIALDIMEPIIASTSNDTPLAKALKKCHDQDVMNLPVVDPEGSYLGVINARNVRRRMSTILLEKQKEADALHSQI